MNKALSIYVESPALRPEEKGTEYSSSWIVNLPYSLNFQNWENPQIALLSFSMLNDYWNLNKAAGFGFKEKESDENWINFQIPSGLYQSVDSVAKSCNLAVTRRNENGAFTSKLHLTYRESDGELRIETEGILRFDKVFCSFLGICEGTIFKGNSRARIGGPEAFGMNSLYLEAPYLLQKGEIVTKTCNERYILGSILSKPQVPSKIVNYQFLNPIYKSINKNTQMKDYIRFDVRDSQNNPVKFNSRKIILHLEIR